jgi:hypothetical protein
MWTEGRSPPVTSLVGCRARYVPPGRTGTLQASMAYATFSRSRDVQLERLRRDRALVRIDIGIKAGEVLGNNK